jgi:hypothetical protein
VLSITRSAIRVSSRLLRWLALTAAWRAGTVRTVIDERDGGWPSVVVAVLRRPSLWTTALVQVARTAPPGWWRRRPFLPRPTADYLAFRQLTATGSIGGAPRPVDVVTWLAWCREWPRVSS